MGRPKLEEKDKKSKLGITLPKDLKDKLNSIANKSNFIESLIHKYFKENG